MAGRRIVRVFLIYAGLALALALLATCSVPRLRITVPEPTRTPPAPTTPIPAPTAAPPATATATPTPRFTPGPSPTPTPTLCAHARVSGQICVAHGVVWIESCCPVWYSTARTDEAGAFEFDNLTAGTFTVSAEGRSWEVVLAGCYDQADVNLCPPPTHGPLGH
jgi:hypothetical protein